MDRWEYKVVEYVARILSGADTMELTIIENGAAMKPILVDLQWIDGHMLTPAEYMEYLNCLGLQGWEVVQVGKDYTSFLLRRPKHNDKISR